MTKFNINFDTQDNDAAETHSKAKMTAAEKIGLISSIPLEDDLKNNFLSGAGITIEDIDYDEVHSKNYDKDAIRGKKNEHKGNGCKVTVTVGGSFAFEAINEDAEKNNERFVSLVGSVPKVWNGKLKGGVSLESFTSNPQRKSYLQGLSGGTVYTPDNIFLYTNKNSKMHGPEGDNWKMPSTFLESTVGDGSNNNNEANFSNDFKSDGIHVPGLETPALPKGIIISDDPFFRAYRYELINAVNTWLGGATDRWVIYPSQVYATGPKVGGAGGIALPDKGSTLFGPDLKAAFFLLGLIARRCAENKNVKPGFFSVPNSISAIPRT